MALEYLITLLEGIVTFVSPCLLPLLPVYVAYFAGGAEDIKSAGAQAGAASTASAPLTSDDAGGMDASASAVRLRRTLRCALGFVLGFTVVFCALGAFAGALGGVFSQHQGILNAVCGIVVIVFGLNYAGILKIPALNRVLSPKSSNVPRGFWSSILFGMVFSIGWTPCVGAFLGSALTLAATTGSTFQGIALLVCYSLGLGIPFVLTAVLIDRLEGAFTWVKQHYDVINKVCGALLIAVGALMATGYLGLWMAALS